MKLALLVYLASIVGSISFISSFILVLSITAISALGVVLAFNEGNETNQLQRYFKHLSFAAIVAGVTCTIVPSEKTLYLMAGAYVTEKIASDDRVQKIGNDVLAVIESKLAEIKTEEKKEPKADTEG